MAMLPFDLRRVDRRRLLRQLSFAIGGGITFTLTAGKRLEQAFACANSLKVTTIQNAIQKNVATNLNLLTPLQLNTLQTLCALILPKPDHKTHAYFCREFVLGQLTACHSEAEKKRVIELLDTLSATFVKQPLNTSFVNADQIMQRAHLSRVLSKNKKRLTAFELLKSLMMFGYFVFEFNENREHKLQYKDGRFVELTFVDTPPLRRQLAG